MTKPTPVLSDYERDDRESQLQKETLDWLVERYQKRK
jgi:hypothetical protein